MAHSCFSVTVASFVVTTYLVALSTCVNAESKPTEAPPDYRTEVLPILMTRCGTCHGPETQEAELRFDKLPVDFSNRAAAHSWREVRNAINAGEMPPEEEPQLSTHEREVILHWITTTMQRAIEEQQSTGGRVVLRRLNRAEYQNTMFDLLGLEMDYTRDLPPDAVSPGGFRNDGRSLRMSPVQLEYYLDTARRALDRVIVSGPPPRVFRHRFEKSNVGGWRGPTEFSNRLERAQKFLVKMVGDYPESGRFRVRVQLRAQLREDKGFPILECAVGYRPDTEVYFRVAGTKEIIREDTQVVEFEGRLENFPLPVRGQGKFPGLVVRLRNIYTDGTPIPTKLQKIKRDGKEVNAFQPEPDLPNLQVESVEFEGPIYSQWPPKMHQQILFESELRDSHEVEYLRQVLERFMTRAFRRPATRSEVEKMFAFFSSIRPHYTRFEEAIRETFAMVLVQPDFLYLMEPAGDEKRPLSNWELASRLSYFLWSTMPDERLFEFCQLDMLQSPKVLEAEVRRMLADSRSQQFVQQFVDQWLWLDRVHYVSVNRDSYPGFDDRLKHSFQSETQQFFQYLMEDDQSALNLLNSTFTMLNEPLARHYGIAGVRGQSFRRVELDPTLDRGGLLGQASILLANSNGKDSHPIRRAVWIRNRLLGDPPAPPPPDVPELDEANSEFAKLSVREQLEVHRDRESCASCHRNIDPWGIALEHFDAVGRRRDTIQKHHGDSLHEQKVVAKDTLPDGTVFHGAGDLREHLVSERQDEFAENFVRSLMAYALGRSLELTDEAEVADLADYFKANEYQLRPLIVRMVSGNAFRTK